MNSSFNANFISDKCLRHEGNTNDYWYTNKTSLLFLGEKA